MISIRDVAQSCGVSPMTVSYVLNDRTDKVSAETREKVLKAIRELGYRPPAPRRRQRTRTGLCIGLVTGSSAHSLRSPGYAGDMTSAIFEATEALGCHLMLFHQSLFHQPDITSSVRAYCDGYCDGLIVLAPLSDSPIVPALSERGFPAIVIGDSDPNATLDFVDLNNKRVAERALDYLLSYGHRRIFFLHGQDFIRSSEQRRLAFRAAAEAAGIPEEVRLELFLSPELPETFGPVRKVLTQSVGTPPFALIGWNDLAAVWAYQEARRVGLRIPEDLSIIGIDNDSVAVELSLTTFQQPIREMARTAVEMLLKRIQGDSAPPRHQLFGGMLIERGSVTFQGEGAKIAMTSEQRSA